LSTLMGSTQQASCDQEVASNSLVSEIKGTQQFGGNKRRKISTMRKAVTEKEQDTLDVEVAPSCQASIGGI
jgi:hypothetical protein